MKKQRFSNKGDTLILLINVLPFSYPQSIGLQVLKPHKVETTHQCARDLIRGPLRCPFPCVAIDHLTFSFQLHSKATK